MGDAGHGGLNFAKGRTFFPNLLINKTCLIFVTSFMQFNWGSPPGRGEVCDTLPYDGDEAFQHLLLDQSAGPAPAKVPQSKPEPTPAAPSTTKVTKVAFKDESGDCPEPPAALPKCVPPSAEAVDGPVDPPASPKRDGQEVDAVRSVVLAPGLPDTLPSPPVDEGKGVQEPRATPNLFGKEVTWLSAVTIQCLFGSLKIEFHVRFCILVVPQAPLLD